MEKEEALPFIIFNDKKGFSLTPEAEDFLYKLENEKLGVVCVVGKYRTGKSFLVNRVLLNKVNEGFHVGSTINACTKGLWIWNKTLESENSECEGMKVLIIDTEGFGGMDENINHDSRILLFSLLLSSFFVYNSSGNIDENALNSLSLLINLAKDIQVKTKPHENEKEDPAQYFPSFLWVVRDFALKMIDANGNSMTSKDYLEKALDLQKGVSDNVESKNRIRRLFKHFFKERDCVTMVRPLESEKELQKLDILTNEELRPEFVDQMKMLRKKVFKKVKPKILNGHILTGRMLVELSKAYIEAINTGHVPNIENAWNYLVKNEYQKALNESLMELERELDTILFSEPIEEADMSKKKAMLKENLVKTFKKKSIESDEIAKYTEILLDKFRGKFKEFKVRNSDAWLKIYEREASPKIEEIEDNLRHENYKSYIDYYGAISLFEKEFFKEGKVNPRKSAYFREIIESLNKNAAEFFIKQTEMQSKREIKTMEQKLILLNSEITGKKRDWEEEKQSLMDKIGLLERDCATQKVNLTNTQEKLAYVKEERDKLERTNKETILESKQKEVDLEQFYKNKLEKIEQKLDLQTTSNTQAIVQLEKENALLKQEVDFSRKEIQASSEKAKLLEKELLKTRNDISQQEKYYEVNQEKLKQLEISKNNELTALRERFEKKIEDIIEETDKKKDIIKEHGKFLVEKTFLENQVVFLKNQLDENKRLHDALLMALQQGLNHNDNENTSELVETNRNLSAAMEKMEMRCKILEEKTEKLKIFKKMVKNSQSLQCIHCSKNVGGLIFLQHISTCLVTSSANSGQQLGSLSDSGRVGSIAANSNSPDAESLLISINQTMVKESSDNKPYTEYLIQIQFNKNKWTIARKYKNFCELHQALASNFPGFKFPDSSIAIINSHTDMNSIFNAKRPTVIEERRKTLQQFLRDLARIDMIKNCKIFRNFLDLDKQHNEQINTSGVNNASNLNNSANLNTNNSLHNIIGSSLYTDTINLSLNNKSLTLPKNTIDVKDDEQSKLNEKKRQISIDKGPVFLQAKPTTVLEGSTDVKIEKHLLPQSPTSFLKAWDDSKNPNKENDYPSKAIGKSGRLSDHSLIGESFQQNEAENEGAEMNGAEFQELSAHEKSLLAIFRGENPGGSAVGTKLLMTSSSQQPQMNGNPANKGLQSKQKQRSFSNCGNGMDSNNNSLVVSTQQRSQGIPYPYADNTSSQKIQTLTKNIYSRDTILINSNKDASKAKVEKIPSGMNSQLLAQGDKVQKNAKNTRNTGSFYAKPLSPPRNGQKGEKTLNKSYLGAGPYKI